MKSILALLVIASVAYAGVYPKKEGGLKGSWTDEIEIVSATADVTAPGIDYYDNDGDYYPVVDINFGDFDDTKTYNASNYYYNSITGTFRFQVTGEATSSSVNSYYDFESTGTIVAYFWTGEGDALRTIPLSCYVQYSSSNDVYCSFEVREHQTPGVYKPSITLIDAFGNWATFDETGFTDVDNNGVWTLEDEHPDTTAPTLATFAVSSAEGEVGTVADLDDDSVYVEISVTVGDGNYYNDQCDVDAATYDWRSSGIQAAYVQIQDEDGNVEDWPLFRDVEVGDDLGTWKYGVRITFYPVMNAGVWTINNVWATDFAGNKAVLAQTGVTYTLTQSDAVEEDGGVFSCQDFEITPFDILDLSAPYTLDDSDDTDIYFTAGCLTKTTANTNYFAVALQTPAYIPAGNTEEIRQLFWNRQAGNEPTGFVQWWNFNEGVSYAVTSLGDDAGDSSEPGVEIFADVATDYFALPPNGQEGDYELAEVYAITEFGAMQRYSLEFGSAAAAAPSIFAVAVAAAVALLF